MRDLRYAACAYTVRRCQKSQNKEVAKYRENVSLDSNKIRFIGFGPFDRKIVCGRGLHVYCSRVGRKRVERGKVRNCLSDRGFPDDSTPLFLGLTVIFLSSHERTHTLGMAHSDRRRAGKIFL